MMLATENKRGGLDIGFSLESSLIVKGSMHYCLATDILLVVVEVKFPWLYDLGGITILRKLNAPNVQEEISNASLPTQTTREGW